MYSRLLIKPKVYTQYITEPFLNVIITYVITKQKHKRRSHKQFITGGALFSTESVWY